MSNQPVDKLLARLVGGGAPDAEATPWDSLAATQPEHDRPSAPGDEKLDNLLQRINNLTTRGAAEPGVRGGAAASSPRSRPTSVAAVEYTAGEDFLPQEPASLAEAGLTETEVESLLLKFFLARGDAAGREASDQLKLPFNIVDGLLRQMKFDQLVVYRSTTAMNDFVYTLTDVGRERARRYSEHCTYFGSAPVTLAEYIASVKAQSLETQHPTQEDLKQAFEDLLISPRMLERLGPAINSGRGMFLFGYPGNGKTSIAERVTRAFGRTIWIPRALNIDGDIMRLFDPMSHEEAPLNPYDGLLNPLHVDQRWVRIKRPTIIVGGELTMDNLEVCFNATTGISEAPVQLKSNCGTLVIDDFGRQRMTTDELLNRWIVPLEKRYDFLNMASGKKVQVPFDQLVIFSTNLEPKDLVDDAFLRRIPYKIEVQDPSEDDFRQLFKIMCPLMGFEFRREVIDELIEKHYRAVRRPFRCCQPRDLLLQIRNYCHYLKAPLELKPEYFDFAVENYFAVM